MRVVPDGPWLARILAKATTRADAYRHLEVFQRIADGSGGIRAAGTTGYEKSADYVARQMSAAGYRVWRQPVPYSDYKIDAECLQQLTPAARPVRALAMRWSPVTPPGGLTPHLVAPSNSGGATGGCAAADYDGLPVRGSIVLIRRGSCGYANQQKVAASLGARAMLLYMDTPSPQNIWRMHAFNRSAFTIPVASVTQQEAERLAGDATWGEVWLRLDIRGHEVSSTTSNVFAETCGGLDDPIVMAGAHVDSVTEAPGMNDNAASVAALMATAQRPAPHQRRVSNKVRFAFWGAEELGDIGSNHYVENLSPQERAKIALYINFELIASPNPVRFVVDGDASDQPPVPNPDRPAPAPWKRSSTPTSSRPACHSRPTTCTRSAPTTSPSWPQASWSAGSTAARSGSRPPRRRRSSAARRADFTTTATTNHVSARPYPPRGARRERARHRLGRWAVRHRRLGRDE
jgi:Peptidase family M28/PA domain